MNKQNEDKAVEEVFEDFIKHCKVKNLSERTIKYNGGDPYRLQKILGHSSMEIVKQYVNMFAEDLMQGFNNFNPLEEFIDNGQYIKMKK